MKQILITIALALGLGLLSTPSFAGYFVNGHAASPAEAQLLFANAVQRVVNGYGIAPAEHASFTSASGTEATDKKCYYVLDVLLCD